MNRLTLSKYNSNRTIKAENWKQTKRTYTSNENNELTINNIVQKVYYFPQFSLFFIINYNCSSKYGHLHRNINFMKKK